MNLLTGDFAIPEDFLKRFSRYNFDGFCLGVLFTNRAFEELVLGPVHFEFLLIQKLHFLLLLFPLSSAFAS